MWQLAGGSWGKGWGWGWGWGNARLMTAMKMPK